MASVERADVEAALRARRELGPGYEDEVVDSLLAKIEARLERPAPRPQPRGAITPLALGSIGCGVAATAIATGNGAAWLAVVAWLAIAVVNVAVARWR